MYNLSNLKDTLVTFQFCEDTRYFHYNLSHAMTAISKMYASYNELLQIFRDKGKK